MEVSNASLVEAAPVRSGAATPVALAIARESALKWLALGGIALIDLVWIAASDFHFPLVGAAGPAVSALLLVAAGYYFRVVRRQLTIFMLVDTLAQLIVCFAVCGVLSYLVISTNQPLIDSQLAAFDRALGFDWPRFIGWVQARPAVDYALWLVYRSSIVQMFMIILVVSHWREDRMREFSGAMMISLVLAILISGALPAAGAYPYYRPAHPEIVAELWLNDFAPLRDGSLRWISPARMEGLISFPSFHTILSLLFIHVTRGTKGFFAAGIVLNAAILVSTLTAGGHYVTDVLGGALVTALSVILYRSVGKPRRSPTQAPEPSGPGSLIPRPAS